MLTAPTATAAPTAVPGSTDGSEPSTTTTSRWYGGQILLLDVASVTTTFVVGAVARASDDTALKMFGTSFAVAGPVVHWLHGHERRAALSLGLRIALPLGLSHLAEATCTEDREDDGPGCSLNFVAGGLAGYALAVLVDVVFLSSERVGTGSPSPRSAASWTPIVGPTRGGATLGIALSW